MHAQVLSAKEKAAEEARENSATKIQSVIRARKAKVDHNCDKPTSLLAYNRLVTKSELFGTLGLQAEVMLVRGRKLLAEAQQTRPSLMVVEVRVSTADGDSAYW